jgi:hypothetical protein
MSDKVFCVYDTTCWLFMDTYVNLETPECSLVPSAVTMTQGHSWEADNPTDNRAMPYHI